ncbi:MAG: transketolase [Candidatus Levybacteria bacterium]|nr:transketolase [Candidatus Levybacteria bacterium]
MNADLAKKAALVRKLCLESTTQAGSGHPTSCLSAADLATVLFDKYFVYDVKTPDNLCNDRFILSKGHAAPLLYTLFALSGGLPIEELKTLRKFGSRLEGHPTPVFPFADAATGSLGQGLSIAAGLAYLAKYENFGFTTYVLLGDGELAEGQIWEAANFCSYYKLSNLVAVVDVNRFGQSQETMFGHDIEKYQKRFEAFGFATRVIDGHDFSEIDKAFAVAKQNEAAKPFVILAKTKKGKGVSFIEDKDGWHGKALKKEELEKAVKELGDIDESLRFSLRKPGKCELHQPHTVHAEVPLANYSSESEIATREVYGSVLAKLAHLNPLIYSLDGDVKNSTFSQDFKKIHANRFIECFIAEQNMVGVAVGLSRLGKNPFVSTFAAFLTRAVDQIRMAAISKANINFVGSHAGVSIGEDGPSQMGLEDFALFGSIPDSIIFHSSDAVSTAKILPLLVHDTGISYLRTLRPKTSVLYDLNEKFTTGGSKILRQMPSGAWSGSNKKDSLTIVAAGITVHESLKAYELLQKEGISVRIVDCYCLKPIDSKTLKLCISETLEPVIISVEDHYEHGGLGDFVLSALADTKAIVHKMAVSKISRSGTKDELLDDAGISAKHIVAMVKQLLK